MRILSSLIPVYLYLPYTENKYEHYPKMFFFPIWLLTLSTPHVHGCLKTSSQDNCVWSGPFCAVNSGKNFQNFNMRTPPRNRFARLCSLGVEAWEETNTWTTATILAWVPQKIVVEHRLPPLLT